MHRTMCLLITSAVVAQEPGLIERTFTLPALTAQDSQDLATVVRSIAEIRDVRLAANSNSLWLKTSPSHMAVAEFTLRELTQPKRKRMSDRFPMGGDRNDLTAIYTLAHPLTTQALRELATTVRSLAEIRQTLVCHSRNAIALRATPQQLELAQWAFEKLDQPDVATAVATGSREFVLKGDPEPIARVFFMPASESLEQFMVRNTQIRTQHQIRRAFPYTPLRAFIARGTAEQIAAAAHDLQ